MARDQFLFTRGLKDDLPNLALAEPAFTTDTEELYIGGSGGNVPFFKNDFVNVKHFGVKGDGITDDTVKINEVFLNGNKNIFFPEGNYLIKDYIRVFENTNVKMSEKCTILNDNLINEYVFVNGEVGNITYATLYNGDGNISFEGGTIDNEIRANKSLPTQAIAIGHANGILIKNINFKNNYQSHFIEINSSKNVIIENCIFDNLNPDLLTNRSCIDIDRADTPNFPPFGSYDNTICENVVIQNCIFTNGESAIGTHSGSLSTRHKEIFIFNNYVDVMSGDAISASWWENSVISNNIIKNIGGKGFQVWGTENSSFLNNDLKVIGTNGFSIDDASGVPSKNNRFINNNIFDALIGMFIEGIENIIENNVIENMKQNAIYVNDSSKNKIYKNVIIGCNQENNNHDAVRLEEDENIFKDNIISNGAYAFSYIYAVVIRGDKNIIDTANLEDGTSGKINDLGTLTAIDGLREIYTGSVTTGILALTDNISEYKQVMVCTGSASGGGYVCDTAKGWSDGYFRVTDDFLNVRTNNGIAILQITNDAELTIIGTASDPIRQIYAIPIN